MRHGGQIQHQLGDVLMMEDGTEAEVTPLKEDMQALASLAIFALIAVLLLALGC